MTSDARTSPDRRAELQRSIAERRARAGRSERSDRTEAPLTEGQLRYWLGWRMTEGRYGRVVRRFEVHGAVERELLERAVRHMLDVCDGLRCSYPEVEGEPRQRLHPLSEVPVTWAEPAAQRSLDDVEAAIEERARQPIDLRTTVPTEVHVLPISPEHHRIVILTHATATDGWTERVVIDALHEGFSGRASDRPRFLDVAAGEAHHAVDDASDLWRRMFEGVELDPWSGLEAGSRTQVVVHDLGPAVMRRLTALADHAGTTVFGLLLTATSVVLGDEWDQERPLVDLSAAGRAHPDAELVAGRMAQLRPFAADLRGDPTFGQLLERVGADLLAVLDVTRAPLHHMLAELPSRGRVAFRSVHVQYRSFPRPAVPRGAPWIASVDRRPEGDTALEISALPLPDGSLRLLTRRRPRPGSDGAIDRAADRVITLLHLLADRADVADLPCSKVAALAADTTEAALPDPHAPLPRRWDRTVLDAVRSQAAARPCAAAVEGDGVTLRYGELLERAEAVAAALAWAGCEPGAPVIITGPRTPGMVVAMLGSLLAGGVMVPLPDDLADGAQIERAEVAGATLGVVVGDRPLPWLDAVVRVDDGGKLVPVDTASAGAALPDVGPDAPAYVFFTSGTSGRARSVVGLHGSLAQFLDWQRSTYHVGGDDRVALLTSVGFDVVLRNVLLPLVSGATVVVPPAGLDPADVLTWLAAQRVTVLHVTPGLARSWLQLAPSPAPATSLRWAFFAGEPLTGELVDRWRGALAGPGHVVNLYGPTETCMVRAAYCVPDEVEPGPVPVGWGIEGSQLLVLDDEGRRIGAGQPGEVVVRTEHGTAGYGNDAELWAQRATLGERPGQVTYRTGDVGWYREDGAVVVQGRRDDEVKVSGVRIQPEDVAQRIRRLPGVGSAAVVARLDEHGDARLVAAVVPADPALTATAVRSALADEVVAAAVPGTVLLLDRLPLTVNGKVDREAILRAAPVPEQPADGHGDTSAELEAAVVGLWREVFPGAEVTLDSDFFELGGHSLIALRLLHRIRRTFGVDLPLPTIFSADTPRAMARLVAGANGEQPTGAPVEEQRVRLAWQQETYAELHELDPDLGRAVLSLARHSRGRLDEHALRSALATAARRHDALRATIDVEHRELIIAPQAEVPLEVVEVDEPLPGSVELRERCVAVAGAGPRLDDPALVRAVLLRFCDDQDVLVLVVHHAMVDGVSLEILADELELAYRAHLAGDLPDLTDPGCGLAGAVAHQAEQEAAGLLESELAFWRDALPSPLPRLELPTDHPRGIRRVSTPAQRQITLRPSDRRRLEELAEEHDTTPYRVLAALWATHVTELAGADEVVVGMPAMSRDAPGSGRTIGMFVSTLPLHLRVGQHDTVADVVARTTAKVSAAGRHRHLSLRHIRELVDAPWDPRFPSLFATSANLIDQGPEPHDDHGTAWRRVNVQADPLHVDLGLRCYLKGAGDARLVLRYDAALFEEATADRILGTYVRLLRAVLDGPLDRQIRELQAELAAPDASRAVHRHVSEVARSEPDAVAIDDGAVQLSYAELDRRVNGMADELHALDVGPGDLVGVHLDRSLELVVAVLAIHRVGAGYVAMPTDLPPARMALVVEDTAPAAIVADRDLPGLPVLRVDLPGLCTDGPDALVPVDPAATAYVIHTSGSTGRPKGAVVTQSSLTAFTDVCRPLFGFGPGERVLLFHSLAFDSSVEEIFATLGGGGTVVVPPAELLGSVPHFLRFIDEQRLTLLVLPTSFWHVLVRELEEGDLTMPTSVRLIIFGGQAAEPGAVLRWLDRVPPEEVRLLNCYGPTECTVSVTSVLMTKEVMLPGEPTPIGRPHPGMEARIVDADLAPVPDGELGELLLAGAQVGAGYLGRPDLTAERFVELDGRRWYRTGDLVRLRADGLLAFHGRNDDQVKVRGFRIEPAEVEAALLDLPDVRDAFVLVEPLVEGGEPILVAHVQLAPGCGATAREVRSAVGERLPAHMVPSRVVLHERLPRTAGGKPDRLALAVGATEPAPSAPSHDGRLPLTPAQAGLFVTELLRGDRAHQLVKVVHRVHGELDVPALQQAFRLVALRHEALRARFDLEDGQPVQWIVDDVPPADELLPLADVSGATDPERERAALLDDVLYRPFRIRGGELLRGVIVRTAAAEHTLAIVVHHIVFDAGSHRALWNDLADAYTASAAGLAWEPSSVPAPYAAAVRERVATAERTREATLEHWQRILDGAPPTTRLPAAADPRDGAVVVRTSLGHQRRDQLVAQAAARRTTPFVLALAACVAALRDLTGDDDQVVGVPLDDRHLAGGEVVDARELVGLFVNTLPVRVRTPGGGALDELLAETRRSLLDAVHHGSVSVVDLVRLLGRDRERAGHAPFNVVCQLLHEPANGVSLGGLGTERELWPAKGTKFDLSLTLTLRDDDLLLRLDRSGAVLGDGPADQLLQGVVARLDELLAGASPSEAVGVATAVSSVDGTAPLLDGCLAAWREAFDDPSYQADDDFFAAGGHSLLAVRLLSLLERHLGIDVPVMTLFDHPTPRALAQVLGGVEAPVVEVPVVDVPPVVEAPVASGPARLHLDRAPLSFAQERFWLLRQLGDDDLYQMPMAWRLSGRLDREALDRALAAVVARHEVLRTRYRTYDDGTPYQQIDPPAPVPVEEHDVREAGEAGIERAWAELRRPFRLDDEWSLRVGLLRTGDLEHHLVLSVHHIAGDAATQRRLWADLRAAYEAACSGDPVPLAPLPFQCADRAVWERAQVAADDGPVARALERWRDGAPEPLELPVLGGMDDPERAVVHRAAADDGVRDLARQLGVTPAAVVLAAACLALTRVTGRDDLVIGLPVSTREPGDEQVIGPFLNTVPLRFRTVPGEHAGDLIRRVASDLLAALAERHVPFELIARSVAGPRHGWDTALTPVVVNLFDGPRPAEPSVMGGLVATPLPLPDRGPHRARFSMTLTARVDAGLLLAVERRAEVPGEVADGWIAATRALLDGFRADPTLPVDRLPAVGDTVERWLRDGLNATGRPYPSDVTVDRLVAEQIATHPTRVAIVDGAARTTYAVLGERAAGVRAQLERAGVQRGDRVAVLLDRSSDLVVTLLACTQLGAPYVPIEPSQPSARTERILEDAGVAAVVLLGPDGGIAIEARRGATSGGPVGERSALDPAYVTYTSGSTGTPKGVVVPHRAIARLVRGADYVQVGPGDVVALGSNPAFDALTWEVWGALANGATLVVLDRDTLLSPTRLRAALREHGVTVMFLTTALVHVLADEQPDVFAGLRVLLFGGEVCDAAAVRRILDAGGPERLLHVYGPTESTTFACWHEVGHVPPDARTLPIGLPIANTTAHVLDAHGRLVPPGALGELHLGGAGLALGYLGDEELTARRFVADHLHPADGARLYRTGDLVRRRADGEIEFVGRADRQVKVRGHRVQPEEVEQAILAHPDVRGAAVEVLRAGASSELAAAVEASGVDALALREHLRSLLPASMVPTKIVVVDQLPVTTNGKLDRGAVCALVERDEPADMGIPDSPAVGGPLARLWAEVLRSGAPDPDATFFELGGHSLSAVQLLTRLRQETGVDLPLSVLFERPTLRSLQQLVDERLAVGAPVEAAAAGSPAGPELVTLRRGSSPPLLLVHPAGGHLFRYTSLVAEMAPGPAVVGVAAPSSPDEWPGSVEALAASYVATWRASGGGACVLGGFSSGGVLAFEMARQLLAAGEPVAGLVLFDPTPEHRPWWHGGTISDAWQRFRRAWHPRAVKRRVHKRVRARLAAVRVRRGRRGEGVDPRRRADALMGHHRRILPRYRPESTVTPLPCLLVLADDRRKRRRPAQVQADRWERLTGSAPESLVVEARHAGPGSFLEPPRVAQVATAVDAALVRFLTGAR